MEPYIVFEQHPLCDADRRVSGSTPPRPRMFRKERSSIGLCEKEVVPRDGLTDPDACRLDAGGHQTVCCWSELATPAVSALRPNVG